MRSFGGNQSDAAGTKFLWFLAPDLNYDRAVKNKDNFLRPRMHVPGSTGGWRQIQQTDQGFLNRLVLALQIGPQKRG
jgi:hypothetical protein